MKDLHNRFTSQRGFHHNLTSTFLLLVRTKWSNISTDTNIYRFRWLPLVQINFFRVESELEIMLQIYQIGFHVTMELRISYYCFTLIRNIMFLCSAVLTWQLWHGHRAPRFCRSHFQNLLCVFSSARHVHHDPRNLISLNHTPLIRWKHKRYYVCDHASLYFS